MFDSVLIAWFSRHRGRPLDVSIAGRIFGGRPGESWQTPRSWSLQHSTLKIQFATTETLIVREPSAIRIGERDELIVPCAAEARFGWHYYGRPRTPDNWCEEVYKLTDSIVDLTRTGPLMPGVERFQYHGDRFVVLG